MSSDTECIVWLVRHGETVWNAAHKISGWIDVDLTERGEQMARNLRPRLAGLHFTSVWSSDLLRARRTAELAYDHPAVPDARLRELDFGPLEGENWTLMQEDMQKEVLAFSEECTRGGELISVFERRIFGFLDELPPGTHLLFVHGGVIRLVLRAANHDRFVPPTTLAKVNWTRREMLDLLLPAEH